MAWRHTSPDQSAPVGWVNIGRGRVRQPLLGNHLPIRAYCLSGHPHPCPFQDLGPACQQACSGACQRVVTKSVHLRTTSRRGPAASRAKVTQTFHHGKKSSRKGVARFCGLHPSEHLPLNNWGPGFPTAKPLQEFGLVAADAEHHLLHEKNAEVSSICVETSFMLNSGPGLHKHKASAAAAAHTSSSDA